ncbi:MAG: hypothetical protein A2Z72_06255 [Omnitrophica bacterium RBG_13_46_9]|nr:MAG: hypothetical protein A2Z72_06255 [Omnitrophica bacterium RBG_13_46_9]
MTKRFAAVIAITMATAGLMTSVLSHSQDAERRPVKYVRGRVCNVNYTGSRVTIQWFYSTGKIAEDKLTFFVPDKTPIFTEKGKIFKDARRIGIVDLVIGDHVVITYYDDGNKENPEAAKIRVLERDRPIAP